eukprot:g13332.t1
MGAGSAAADSARCRIHRTEAAPLVPEEKDGRPLEVKIWRLDGLPVHRSHEAASANPCLFFWVLFRGELQRVRATLSPMSVRMCIRAILSRKEGEETCEVQVGAVEAVAQGLSVHHCWQCRAVQMVDVLQATVQEILNEISRLEKGQAAGTEDYVQLLSDPRAVRAGCFRGLQWRAVRV